MNLETGSSKNTFNVYTYKNEVLLHHELFEKLCNEETEDYARAIGAEPFDYLLSFEVDEKLDKKIKDKANQKIETIEYKIMNDMDYRLAVKFHSFRNRPRLSNSSYAKESEIFPVLIETFTTLTNDADEEISSEDDESYENCYGLINKDANDFFFKLFDTREGTSQSLADKISTNDKMTINWCKRQLADIRAESYNLENRKLFMMANYRLSCLGVAPRWRGIVRDKYFKTHKSIHLKEQDIFMRDIQIFDLEWIFRQYHGHHVDTTWGGVFEGIFNVGKFDTKKASIIAEMKLKPAKKAEYLMLTQYMERELFMIRSNKAELFIRSLLNKSQQVRVDLTTAAQRM